MKKSTSLSVFAIRQIIVLAVAVAALALSRPASAVNVIPTHTIDITENSSTSLTVLYDNMDITASAVMNTSANHWTLTFSNTITFANFDNFWTELDDPNATNLVEGTGTNMLFITSDLAGLNGLEKPDGTIQTQSGSVNGQQVFFDTRFFDHGDAATGVPESASSLALLFLALAPLLGLSRLRSFRIA